MIVQRIDKYLDETFKYIQDIVLSQLYDANIARAKSHSFNGRKFQTGKDKEKFVFSTTTLVRPGVQNNKELIISKDTEMRLTNGMKDLFVKGRNVLINKIGFNDFDSSILEKSIEGEFTSLSTRRERYYKSPKQYRILIPTNDAVRLLGDISGWGYAIDGNLKSDHLIKVKINKNDFHFYSCTNKNAESFLVIDSLNKIHLEEFLKEVNSILLSYAFLKGNYFGSYAYIFTYKANNLKTPVSMMYCCLGESIYGGFPVHSTKPHWLMDYKGLTKYRKGKNGFSKRVGTESLNQYMESFPEGCFSNLCELILNKNGIQRTVVLFISNHKSPVEIKVPTLFVALENITRVLNGNSTSIPKIIDDANAEVEIKNIIKKAAKEINSVKQKYFPQHASQEDKKAYSSDYDRLKGKLNKLNEGTNNKKLTEPFLHFGYHLTPEEGDLIYKKRNTFIHGSDYMPLGSNSEEEFKELFHISLQLQKLIAILLLKASGYSGYILNNVRVYDHITGKKIDEDVFIKI